MHHSNRVLGTALRSLLLVLLFGGPLARKTLSRSNRRETNNSRGRKRNSNCRSTSPRECR